MAKNRTSCLNKPQVDPWVKYGERYHEMCDVFDCQNLTGPPARAGGDPMPANHNERRLMITHSRTVRKMLLEEVLLAGGTEQDLQQAIRTAAPRR